MSQRYGRKRRKAHVAKMSELLLKTWRLERALEKSEDANHALRRRLNSFDAMLRGMADHAKADVQAQMHHAIKHAETELLRRGLEEMRSAGMSNMEFASIHRDEATIGRITFRPPEIQFAMLVQPIEGTPQTAAEISEALKGTP